MMGKVSLLQYLSVGDVNHLNSGRQSFSKMRLVVDKVTRLNMVAAVNTSPRTAAAFLVLYEATNNSIVADMTSKDQEHWKAHISWGSVAKIIEN
eukprot:15356735-Ditylum_brightwellii.AAC.1